MAVTTLDMDRAARTPLAAEVMPADHRQGVVSLPDQAMQVVSDLMRASPWRTKAAFDQLEVFCGHRRSASDYCDTWDGQRNKNPFTHPEFHRKLLNDRPLLDLVFKEAMEGQFEKHFAARDILQELIPAAHFHAGRVPAVFNEIYPGSGYRSADTPEFHIKITFFAHQDSPFF